MVLNSSQGGQISYSLMMRGLNGLMSAFGIFIVIKLFISLNDPKEVLWIKILALSFFTIVFIVAFLFFLETFRTIVFSKDTLVMFHPYKKKSILPWNEITSVGYLKEQVRFSADDGREVSLPTNLSGVSFLLDFAEEHLNPNIKERFQLAINSAKEAATSAKPFF